MADTKISDLTSAGALTGTEATPLAVSGASRKVTLAGILAYLEGALPDFFATMRTLSPSDDAPIDGYATDLAAYVADIDEAQDLLDAAVGAGDVATAIALLSGGGGGPPTYTDLAAVIADIAATTLAEGDAWMISWTGDTYIADGEVIGFVRRGVPSWGDMLPGSKLGTTYSTVSSAGAGARTTDGAGRLRLTVGAADADEVLADLGFEGRPYRRTVMALQYTSATPANGSEQLLGARLSNAANTAWLSCGLRHFSGWSLLLTASAGSTSPISPGTALVSAAFASGRRVDLEIDSGPDFSARSFSYEMVSGSSAAESSSAFTQPTGLGDWRTSVEVRVQLKLASSNIAGQVDLIGLICEV